MKLAMVLLYDLDVEQTSVEEWQRAVQDVVDVAKIATVPAYRGWLGIDTAAEDLEVFIDGEMGL